MKNIVLLLYAMFEISSFAMHSEGCAETNHKSYQEFLKQLEIYTTGSVSLSHNFIAGGIYLTMKLNSENTDDQFRALGIKISYNSVSNSCALSQTLSRAEISAFIKELEGREDKNAQTVAHYLKSLRI